MLAVVVDVGLGNLRSVQKALETAGAGLGGLKVVRSADPELVRSADRLIVPGQGGFRDCARALSGELGGAVLASIQRGIPYFGICLGLQVLFEESAEAPGERGLGVFPGRVERLQGSAELKIPHIGWNQLSLQNGGHPHLGDGEWFYFVHSYAAVPSDPELVKAIVEYGPNRVTAALGRDNVFATQFHPEKSQRNGLALLGAFLSAKGS